MKPAPIPDHEDERLAALLGCDILDSEPEPSFDDITRLAGQICGTPIALVSLVDADRQWFKARVGLGATQTGRDVSFCGHAVAASESLVVEDATRDERFADNPLVTGAPSVRFYAGVPLMVEDKHAVGTLCVIDTEPRTLAPAQLAALTMLARQVSLELSLRRRLNDARATLPPPSPATSGARAMSDRLLADRYRLRRLLGVGGMGAVVEATDEQLGRRVAIKFLRRDLWSNTEAQERFAREARVLMNLVDVHVTQVFDLGNLANGAPYIVMELLEGESLREVIDRRGTIPVAEAAAVVRQAGQAIAGAHAAGILHRDIKPENLFLEVDPEGRVIVKVLDFGIAKIVGESHAASPRLTGVSTVIGTPYYMAPEQMMTVADLDARADVWSLGVVLYELLTGAVPFAGESQMEVFGRAMSLPMPDIRTLSPELDAIVRRCLEKNRADRFPDAQSLCDALAAHAAASVSPMAGGGAPAVGDPARAPRARCGTVALR